MYMIFLFFSTIFSLLLLHWMYCYFMVYKKMKNIQATNPRPLFGNCLDCTSLEQLVPIAKKWLIKWGPTYKVMVGYKSMLVIADVKFLEYFLSSMKILKKSEEYTFIAKWLGGGLLTSTGEKWAKRRKLLTPSFHFQILDQFIEIFDKSSNILVKKLKKETNNESTDIYNYVTLCSLDIICETVMGIKIHAQDDEHSEYVKAVKEISQIIFRRVINPLKQIDLLYMLTRDYYKEKKLLQILHDTTDSVIKKRRDYLINKNETQTNGVDGVKKRSAFLDILLQSNIDGQPLTDEDIREEVDTFMFEGHDTTSSGISFALYNISKYPDIQKKIMEELFDIFGDDKERPATIKELQDMKYLEMVIKESLRLYPPVPVIGRKYEKDIEYEDCFIPKNTKTCLSIIMTHRNPEFYPNPEIFDPERFTIENRNKTNPYTYIPFSAGPRNCIGQKFAMLELKSTISKVLRYYELLPVENYEPVLCIELTLRSSTGILLRLKERS